MATAGSLKNELDQFERHLDAYRGGTIDFEAFRKIRVWQGIYSFRGTADRYMIRIKIPQGRVSAAQLATLADLAEKYSHNGGLHITTRQDVEFYAVRQDHLMEVLRALAEVGITTRATGGNGVRNITLCPRAGISSEEAFDVTPYATALAGYFAVHPLAQNLPRKVKIAFEGCREDHIRGMIHDLGIYGVLRDTERGFQVYVGGGLGAAPRAAGLLEAFTPAGQLLPTCEAILAVFHQHGNRASRDRSRLKFLLQDWGVERFREEVSTERTRIVKTGRPWPELGSPEPPPLARPTAARTSGDGPDAGFQPWLEHNVLWQRQPGFASVHVRCPLGDVGASQLKHLATVARDFCEGRIRTTIAQNLVLRWVPKADLADLYRELEPHGLTRCCAEGVMDMTRCAGADSCLSALTHSRGLAVELEALFANGLGPEREIRSLVIKISGCPHACSQHPIADVGLHGASRTTGGRQVPCYQILAGGRTERGHVQFAAPLQVVAARRTPAAVKHLLEFYLGHKTQTEGFSSFVQRVGAGVLQDELKPFSSLPAYEEAPDLYKDWGSDQDYRIEARKGECYA